MYKTYNKMFKREVVEIFVGEYYVSDKGEMISTLLGSCISVCLIDETNGVCGMNHFLLPNITTSSRTFDEPNQARFGESSMELLIEEMIKSGSRRSNLKAKVFGGGKVLKTSQSIITVNEDNINFIHEFLKRRSIPIVAKDIGGTTGRRIYFDTKDGSVYVGKVKNINIENI